MREKLIELLRDVQYLGGLEEKVADHLIANGVTIAKDNNVPSKWIPVTERLPDAWVDVLSCDINKNLTVDCVDEKGKWYSEYTDLEEVTHWMPLPEPPKGE
jgi:hypothetical protein